MAFLDKASEEIFESTGPIVSLNLWLARHYEAQGLTPADAAERADRDLPRFREAVARRIREAKVAGVLLAYDWSSAADDELERVGVFTQEQKQVEAVLKESQEILEFIKQSPPELFERVGAFLLTKYGIPPDMRAITARSNDGGFDFYGVEDPAVEDPYLEPLNRLRRVRFRVLGQAKRYTSGVIDHDQMDAFAWRLEMYRAGSGRRYEALEAWFRYADRLPIVGMFITTSAFSAGALPTAQTAVIIPLDGRQISHDLAVSSSVTDWRGDDGSLDLALFQSYFGT